MEEWRDIKGYEGLCQVSNMGRVKSLNYNHTGKEGLLKQIQDKDGYLTVHFHYGGVNKKARVHRLVAEAFIPNPDNLPQVNHKNEIKDDNRVENLEFCDANYNNNYGTRGQRISKKRGYEVYQYDLNGELIGKYPSVMEVQRQLGFWNGSISGCCRGEYKTAYGYKWSYKK